MKNHNGFDRGRVNKLFVIIAVLCFLAFQCVLVYGIMLIAKNSFAGPRAPKVVKRSAEEADTAAKIVKLFGFYEKADLYFTRFYHSSYETGKKNREKSSATAENALIDKYEKALEANLSTIENTLISYLDVDSNSTLSAFLLENRILISEQFSYTGERTAALALGAYANYKIEKGDTARALAAVNSLLSLSLIAQKGNNGEKHLLSGMIAIAIKKTAYDSAAKLINSKKSLSAEQFTSLMNKIEKYSFLYDDIFSMIADEKNTVDERAFREFFTDIKSRSKVQWVAANLAVDLLNFYYGDAVKQYSKAMDDIIACKGLSYKETTLKLDAFFEKIGKMNKSLIELINSDINPLVLMAVPNVKRAVEQQVISKLMVNGVILRAAIQKHAGAGAKAPANTDELSKLDELKKFPDICSDFFSGAPLKYSVSSTGEVNIYSVGPDMTDDGGKFGYIHEGSGFPTKGYDLKL